MSTFLHTTVAAFAGTSLPLIALALALFFVGLIVAGERWRVILTSMGSRMTLARAVLVNLAGIFVRNVTPTSGLGGDAVRVGLLRSAGVPLGDATVTFLCARIVELPAIACLVILALPALTSFIASPSRKALALGSTAFLAIALVLWRRDVRERIANTWERLGASHPPPSAIVHATLLALVSWAETTLRLIVIAAALHTHLSLSQGSALTVFSIVGGLVPTVGGLGAIEGSLMAGLLLFGVPAGTATAITLVERGISYGLSTAAGAVALGATGGSDLLQRLRRSSS